MDAFVQLALIEKSRRIFATGGDTFLSFPLLSPLAWGLDDLSRLSAPASGADYALAADFARAVNFVPRDMVAGMGGDEPLWDIYGDVLDRAEPAAGTADPEAQAQGAAARALLYEEDADGTRRESAAYLSYRRHRDAWIAAREDHATQRMTGETATDPAERLRWYEEGEPALRAAIDAAEAAWREAGRKDEIEAAVAAWRRAAANDPQGRWDEWRAGFEPDLDLLTDAWGGRFAPTAFAPRDIASGDAWLRFEMTGPEMAALVAGAPPELRVLQDGRGAEVERVAFDYRSVAVVRPWFQPEALTSGLWRAPAGASLAALSDGADPPQGRCPAYVSALIFVRRLRVTTRAGAPPEASGGAIFTLPAERLTSRQLRLHAQATPGLRVTAAPVPPEEVRARAARRLRERTFEAMRPEAGIAGMLRPEAAPGMTRAEPAFQARALALAARAPVARAALMRRHRALDVVALSPGLISVLPVAPGPTPDLPPPPPEDDDVSVLAFVCKRLPRSPDPLPGLRWP